MHLREREDEGLVCYSLDDVKDEQQTSRSQRRAREPTLPTPPSFIVIWSP